MARVPAAFVDQQQLDAEIAKALPLLGRNVAHINYSLGEDWSGDPSIFLRVLLTDQAAAPDGLGARTRDIRNALEQSVGFFEKWGVLPYFSFRSQSEQEDLKDPEWA